MSVSNKKYYPQDLEVPTYTVSSHHDEIIRTHNFIVRLDTEYQKLPGIIRIDFRQTQPDWSVLGTDKTLCDELSQLIHMTEFILIKSFKIDQNNLSLQDNINYAFINFNGEQLINKHNEKKIFIRQVPRYHQPYQLKVNHYLKIFEDSDYGRGFYFGDKLVGNQINSDINKILLEILRYNCDYTIFSSWYKKHSLQRISRKFYKRDNLFDPHKHPDKTGLCEITLTSNMTYGFALLASCQNIMYRTVLSIQGKRYPALRFMTSEIYYELFKLTQIWCDSIKEITGNDCVYKILVLMNHSVSSEQQVHLHLIPSYNINGTWERFAKAPFIHSKKGYHDYKTLAEVAYIHMKTPQIYVQDFRNILIKNLIQNNVTINWP